jgi:hypothetical protein
MNEEGREECAVDVVFFLLSGAEACSGASGWAVRMRGSRCLSGRKGGCISQFVIRENEVCIEIVGLERADGAAEKHEQWKVEINLWCSKLKMRSKALRRPRQW